MNILIWKLFFLGTLYYRTSLSSITGWFGTCSQNFNKSSLESYGNTAFKRPKGHSEGLAHSWHMAGIWGQSNWIQLAAATSQSEPGLLLRGVEGERTPGIIEEQTSHDSRRTPSRYSLEKSVSSSHWWRWEESPFFSGPLDTDSNFFHFAENTVSSIDGTFDSIQLKFFEMCLRWQCFLFQSAALRLLCSVEESLPLSFVLSTF